VENFYIKIHEFLLGVFKSVMEGIPSIRLTVSAKMVTEPPLSGLKEATAKSGSLGCQLLMVLTASESRNSIFVSKYSVILLGFFYNAAGLF